MDKRKNLRERMLQGYLNAALIPVVLFALISQVVLQGRIMERMEERLETGRHSASQCFTLLLGKYDMLVQDFCTDADVLETVRRLGRGDEVSREELDDLHYELGRICNRGEGVEGITLQLENGQTYFYDYQKKSFRQSDWADGLEIPRPEGAGCYRGLSVPVSGGERRLHLFQVVCGVYDYREEGRYLGSVALSLNEEYVCGSLQSDVGMSVYLLDADTIVCAMDKTLVGTSFGEMKKGYDSRYASVLDEKSGMTLCVELSEDTYHDISVTQGFALLFIAILTVCMIMVISFKVTEPSIQSIRELERAIGLVEMGDFSARVKVPEQAVTEIMRIGQGFNEMLANIEHLLEENKRSSMEQRNAELSALEAQIDPHFLYNTLDTINWKAIENEQYEISEMIVALADILRYIVKNAGGVTTVSKELAWLERYIMLQSLKLGRMPVLEIIVSEDVMGCEIHKLLLQPFVENAVKYGFAEKEGECVLIITAKITDGQLHVMVEDNGRGIPPETLERLNDESREFEGHVGVSNVRKRLKLYYGEEAMVYFESAPGEYTRVHLFIPVGEGRA